MKTKNELELQITKAKKCDAQALLDYLKIVGGESDNLLFGSEGLPATVEQEERFIESLAFAKTSAMFVAKIDDEIVSTGSVMSPSRARIAHQCDIALSVKKTFWGLGIGKAMMNEMIDFARNAGLEIVHLGVKQDNKAAYELYRSLGFEEFGVYKKFFKVDGNYFDEILMNLYL